jgi:hypothetical protein
MRVDLIQDVLDAGAQEQSTRKEATVVGSAGSADLPVTTHQSLNRSQIGGCRDDSSDVASRLGLSTLSTDLPGEAGWIQQGRF